jgi:hypothetical protein
MRKIIDKKTYDTKTAKLLGVKYEGEFGQPDGYEEQLFVTKNKQHFVYGVGGPESKYPKQVITLITDEEAQAWKQESGK